MNFRKTFVIKCDKSWTFMRRMFPFRMNFSFGCSQSQPLRTNTLVAAVGAVTNLSSLANEKRDFHIYMEFSFLLLSWLSFIHYEIISFSQFGCVNSNKVKSFQHCIQWLKLFPFISIFPSPLLVRPTPPSPCNLPSSSGSAKQANTLLSHYTSKQTLHS